MAHDWRPWVELVERHQRFLLTTHVRPDGDALGSELGLAAALKQRGKQVRIVNATPYSERYAFLDPDHEAQTFAPPGAELQDTQVLVVLDTGTWNQLGVMADFIRGFQGTKVVIDHHVTQDDLGATRFVDAGAEATGRLVYEAIQALKVSLNLAIATPLFVALAMDTGWFRHSNTTPATFVLAAELVRAGAKPSHQYLQLFERNTPGRLKLMGKVLSRLDQAAGGRIAHSAIHRADYAESSPQDAEDLTNLTVGLTGAEVMLLFTELPEGGVKVSFRARDHVNVATVAEQFGGGGHRQAAGATVPGPLDLVQARVLLATEKALSTAPV